MGRTSALALLAAAALSLSACGGEGSERQATSPAPQAKEGAQSEQPHRGGEASIEDFGQEAQSGDRGAILAAFHGYLGALGRRDAESACGHLSSAVQRSLRQLLRGKGAKCAEILPKLLAPSAPAVARSQAAGKVSGVRVEGESAFVLFEAPGAESYQLTMRREDGRWKVATLTPSVLVPSL